MHFGTNGIRGLFEELNPETAVKLAYGIGRYFNGGKIVVARDCRLTGEVLKNAVVAGLASVGCTVIDLGIVSSPTAEYMIRKLDAEAAVIITASHNPPEWNAIKVVDGKGIAVSKERGKEIEKLVEGKLWWNRVGRISFYENATKDHIKAIIEMAGKAKKKKIILDCGNGTACVIAPPLFKELGCDILTLNSHMDGRFPGRPSEPTEKNVENLIRAVKAEKVDCGIAWDADGDRVIFVDEKGQYIIGDMVYALSILWSDVKGDVVTTVATSRVVEDAAGKKGLKTRYTAIGAPYLCEAMEGAGIGGEEVGGVIWPELSLAKDGFLTGAMLVKALERKTLSEWVKELPSYYNVKEKIPAKAKEKSELVKKALEYAKKEKLRYNDIDGVRVDYEDSWVIVRPSGTEDYVRIFAEAKTLEKAGELVEKFRKITG
ncbi:phosphoglucosamine mutase [Candidatus Micrarchaeota archaeon]|nr:phosphoglucosamine mutase [Candidatus Micrarchaeota archaeon]